MNDALIRIRDYYVNTVFRAMLMAILIGGVTLILVIIGWANVLFFDAENIQLSVYGIKILPYFFKATGVLIVYIALCPVIRTAFNLLCKE